MEMIALAGILLALLFNLINGMNDAAHSVATLVATRAISPLKASAMNAACNFIGPFILTTAIATTIGTGILTSPALTAPVLVTAIISAIILVLLATFLGFPVSSSHAMVGGMMGAGVAAVGISALVSPGWGPVIGLIMVGLTGAVAGALAFVAIAVPLHGPPLKAAYFGALCGITLAVPLAMATGVLVLHGILAIVVFIFISPMLGAFTAFLFDIIISHLFRHSRQNRMKRIFQPLQVVANAWQAIGHGSNDGQHAVGVITALLVAEGVLASFSVPLWVTVSSAAAIAFGTALGGWSVIDVVARKITKIRPYQGFAASTSGAGVLTLMTFSGIPVSSTHVISGSIVGAGVTRGWQAVNWTMVREIIGAWIITIPAALAISFCLYWAARIVGLF